MKTYFLLLICLILGTVSCIGSLDSQGTNSSGPDLVLEASFEDIPVTKTTVQSDGKSVWWSAHEDINVFYGNSESSKFTSLNDEPVAKAKFKGSIKAFTGETEGGEPQSFWAVYPYNEANTCDGNSVTVTLSPKQVPKADTFRDRHWLTIAKSQNLSLSFYAVGAGFRFSVTKEGVTSVIFKGNNDEVLAGEVKVAMDASNRPVVIGYNSTSKEILLTPPKGDAFDVGELYYITFLPTNFEKGFTITFNTNTETGTRVYNTPVNFRRTDVHKGKDFDSNVTYVPLETPTIPPPEGAIDLGLSVLWASNNLGATAPQGYGHYFAWGETQPQKFRTDCYYNWQSYSQSYEHNSGRSYSKYSDIWPFLLTLAKADDAAYVYLGEGWRMPNSVEWAELIEQCDWIKTSIDGVIGYLVKSRVNDNSIFLPYGGHKPHSSGSIVNNANPQGTNQYGRYWSSHRARIDQGKAYYLIIGGLNDDLKVDSLDRCKGCTVRAVYEGQ